MNMLSALLLESCTGPIMFLHLQERLEELRKHTVEVSKHDSTLDEFEVPDDRSLEDRYIQAQHHLAAFQGSLDKLKANGEAIPGFDGVEQLLEDPTSAGVPRVCSLFAHIIHT